MAKNINTKEFFASLYEKEQVMPSVDYERVISRLAGKANIRKLLGDQALQNMLVSFVHEKIQSLEQVEGLRAGLPGIKQKAKV